MEGRPIGRPTDLESARRQRVMLALLDQGMTWQDAATTARVKPATVLRLLDRPDFAPVAAAILERVA